jgi:hypothetical protein
LVQKTNNKFKIKSKQDSWSAFGLVSVLNDLQSCKILFKVIADIIPVKITFSSENCTNNRYAREVAFTNESKNKKITRAHLFTLILGGSPKNSAH